MILMERKEMITSGDNEEAVTIFRMAQRAGAFTLGGF
jgi:hypothetical protein